jgi:hypothetical protein
MVLVEAWLAELRRLGHRLLDYVLQREGVAEIANVDFWTSS